MRLILAAIPITIMALALPAPGDGVAVSRAEAALADLTRAFWVGGPADGHLRMDAHADGREIGAWEQAQAVAAYYGAWKYLGDRAAGQKVAAEWFWIKRRAPTSADLATCAAGARFNFASDDTGWDVGMYLQAYDVTHDLAALTAAKASLDCAWRTWWDTALGGGYWYNSEHTAKTIYQAVLALDCEWVFRLTRAKEYQDRAIATENWTTARLGRSDGLYWKSIDSEGRVPAERVRYLINPTQSVTMIVGNMAQAVVQMWLSQDTGQAIYAQRATATAAGIRTYETDKAGVLINDQDGYTDGWAMVPFAHEVVAKLALAERDSWTATLRTSAAAVWQFDRHADGTFGSDWGGPLEGGPWARKGDVPPSKISVSGGAANVIVAGAIP